EIDVGDGARGFELQEVAPAGFGCADVERAAVPARSAVVVLSLLRFFPAPVVRDGDFGPGGVVEAGLLRVLHVAALEAPSGVQSHAVARRSRAGECEPEEESKSGSHGCDTAANSPARQSPVGKTSNIQRPGGSTICDLRLTRGWCDSA